MRSPSDEPPRRTPMRLVRCSAALVAIASGLAAEASVSISRDLLMSQFWQNLQARLQPAVPNESTALPG